MLCQPPRPAQILGADQYQSFAIVKVLLNELFGKAKLVVHAKAQC
ncbi:Uncharacterised protein [Mycobacteroides abscessus subsp. massiliense]|nr:Uncharacterised protein [Mycobacteroides abscessus]SLH44083.1 Uncharacterised protein [Mycobacteroides abscessus subsp. massiliense]